MKEITFAEFLSIINSNDIDKIEEIERKYNVCIFSHNNKWYGNEVNIIYKLENNTEN